MTINELFKVWLHNKNPYAIVNVWDRGIGDYILRIIPPTWDGSDEDYLYKIIPPMSNQNAEEIGKMEVKCFYTSEENGKNPILTINVGEYN